MAAVVAAAPAWEIGPPPPGHELPAGLRIYAFRPDLALLDAMKARPPIALPTANLTLVDRQDTYAHNDPTGTYPHNAFFDHMVPSPDKIGTHS